MGEFADNLQKCPQLIIYLGLAFLSVGTSFFFTNSYFVESKTGGMSLSVNLFMHLFQILVISTIFYYLCKFNYQTVGWILLLFPLIIAFVLILAFFGFVGAASGVKAVIEEDAKKKNEEEEKKEQETFKGFDGKYDTNLVTV